MDREQFEKEADECGMMEYLDLHCDSVGIQMILDMVNDAVAAEREACAKLVRDDYSNKHAQLWLKRIDEAVRAERNKLAAWMIQFGFATGHGDTMEELVDALGTEIVDRIDGEVEAEREACAQLCEKNAPNDFSGYDTACRQLAEAIRARST
jgi:hypothetical protein